jgi:hypothetical protein
LVSVIVEFGATFLGVFGAYYATDYYDKRQKRKEEQERKAGTLTAIRNELDFNKELLSGLMKSYEGNQIFQEVIFSTRARMCVWGGIKSSPTHTGSASPRQ